MIDIIKSIFEVGQTVFGLRKELADSKQARKQQVSDFLSLLAQTIEDASASLKQGIYPHGKCQELLSHSQHMESAIGDLIGVEKARELGSQLKEVWEIERLHGELSNQTPLERETRLHVLDQSAGFFRATAAFVRVSP